MVAAAACDGRGLQDDLPDRQELRSTLQRSQSTLESLEQLLRDSRSLSLRCGEEGVGLVLT